MKAPPDVAPSSFKRGKEYPRAIAWFGFRSFWGHLWSLAASVIASEDIDSRDWMQPDDPGDLTRRIAGELGGAGESATLTDALDRDLFIDFVADTGDDVSVSRAVAELIFESYELETDEGVVELPRGDVLLFGGDTAYPVASDLEIHNRVIVPFNQVLKQRSDGVSRVLLGIPGNHDWYAGLDGFGRMFRAPLGEISRSSRFVQAVPKEALEPAPEDIKTTQLAHFFQWAEAFRVGRHVVKRAALPLIGYRPVQNASYWALRVAPDLDLWGPDRQLYDVDDRQRVYFDEARTDAGAAKGIALCLADPPYAFLQPHENGMRILRALDLAFETDGILAITGDIHHYCRLALGTGMQVTAGGGGAFLHPARILREGMKPPEAEFPGPKASLSLAFKAPIEIALGRAGLLVHTVLFFAYLPMHLAARHEHPTVLGAALTGSVIFVVLALVYAPRNPRAKSILGLSLLAGVVLGAVPFALGHVARAVNVAVHFAPLAVDLVGLVISVLVGAFIVGGYFLVLTVLGVAADLGFGPLAHPGYKHFVRLRIRKDGSGIDGYAIGKVDPINPESPVVLVDKFSWSNPVRK